MLLWPSPSQCKTGLADQSGQNPDILRRCWNNSIVLPVFLSHKPPALRTVFVLN